jgi:hypothetical protein
MIIEWKQSLETVSSLTKELAEISRQKFYFEINGLVKRRCSLYESIISYILLVIYVN